MKMLILFLCVMFKSILLFSQENQDIEEGLTVVAFKGLNIRNSPSTNGKILASVPFGKVVFPAENNEFLRKDTIGNIKGEWIKVSYDKIEGFAFAPYLIDNLTIDRAKNTDEMILIMEGMPGWSSAYEPDFHYYGLYDHKDTLRWEKVNVSFLVATVDGIEKFDYEHCLEDFPNIKITTDRNESSLLIIGSRNMLDKDKIKTLFGSPYEGYEINPGFLNPEQIISIEFNNTTYNFRAFDSISIDFENKTFEKHYQLQFYTGYYKRYEYSNLQNISTDLRLYDSGERHAYFSTPVFQWVGDINGDGILDAIVYEHGMVEHGGTHWGYTLFLGKKVKEKIFLQKVWSYFIGSCV